MFLSVPFCSISLSLPSALLSVLSYKIQGCRSNAVIVIVIGKAGHSPPASRVACSISLSRARRPRRLLCNTVRLGRKDATPLAARRARRAPPRPARGACAMAPPPMRMALVALVVLAALLPDGVLARKSKKSKRAAKERRVGGGGEAWEK